jgi:two-component system, OmpR family, sensor histidine kinase KdpD
VPPVLERKQTPEQILQQVESEEHFKSRGRLKIFVGYASGVGKTFKMIDEGRRRFERGQDVVVAAIQPELAVDAQCALAQLEIIPLVEKGCCQMIDMPALLRRKPKICLVDGLAYDNPPGAKFAKRWQDVEELLESGISVITSVNLQHIEEKRAQVEAITHTPVTQTIPLSFLQMADEIVIVDAPTESCMRLEQARGGDGTKLTQFKLSELREIALLMAADVVDKQLERYLARHGLEQTWGTQERILVCLTPEADAERMLESAVRNRDRFHGELIAVAVRRPEYNKEQVERVQKQVDVAKAKGAEVLELDGGELLDQLIKLAQTRGVTQIYVGQRGRDSWKQRAFGNDLDRLIRSAEGMDVRVFPHV